MVHYHLRIGNIVFCVPVLCVGMYACVCVCVCVFVDVCVWMCELVCVCVLL